MTDADMRDPDLTDGDSTDAVAALLAALWERFAGLALERVGVLDRYAAALAAGDDPPELRAAASAAAHKLAGALGTYGRNGSGAAAQLQDALRAGGDRAAVPGLVEQVRRGVQDP